VPRFYFALDLQDDPDLIAEYERWHEAGRIWPDIVESIRSSGIKELEIFRVGNRLVMILEAPAKFDFAAKAAADAANPRVQEWEALMWKFQRALPWARPGEKWVRMRRIF